MANIADVIQNNNWKSTSIRKSTAVNRLFKNDLLNTTSELAKAAIQGINQDINLENVQSTFQTGLVSYDWAEQNLGDSSADVASAQSPIFDQVTVKTFYGNMWWDCATIQRDLLNTTKPIQTVNEYQGRAWEIMWNKIMAKTLKGLGGISEITEGSSSSHFARSMVYDVRDLKGDMGYGKLGKMFMSSGTLRDILDKQDGGTHITSKLITPTYGKVTITGSANGASTEVTNDVPSWVFDGVTPVLIDNDLDDGKIFLLNEGAFVFAQKSFDNPLSYVNNPDQGNGAGVEKWGSKQLYMLHPLGFSFTGVLGTNYASKSGLTLAELEA